METLIMTLWESIRDFFVGCTGCGKRFRICKGRKMSTQYQTEEDNWVFCCKECYADIQEYWKERWQDYYSDCM